MNKIISYKDNRYIVKRVIKNEPEENLDFWKSIIQHDLALKKDSEFWFLNEITEIFDLNDGKT
jgi:hypothetical protein|tara:strand:- start:792 stop:980 length:189 start_codon:yes stop_codon:yes gene_type:complete